MAIVYLPGGYVFQAVIIAPALVGLIICIIRATRYIKIVGVIFRMPLIVYCVAIVGHLFQIANGVDHQGFRSLYDPFGANSLFTTATAPVVINLLTVLFYWNRALKSFNTRSIEWTRKYIYILMAVITVSEVITSTLRVIYASPINYALIPILYLIVESALIIYIGYTGYSIFRFFKNTNELSAVQLRSKETTVRMTKVFAAIDGCIIILFIFTALGLIPNIFDWLPLQLVVWGICCTMVSLISILQTLLFRDPKAKSGTGVTPHSAKTGAKSGRSGRGDTHSNKRDTSTNVDANEEDLVKPNSDRSQTATDRQSDIEIAKRTEAKVEDKESEEKRSDPGLSFTSHSSHSSHSHSSHSSSSSPSSSASPSSSSPSSSTSSSDK